MLLSCDDFEVEDIIKHFARSRAFLCINTSIQIFYQDVLFGLLDKNFADYDFASHYRKYYEDIQNIGNQGDMNDIFEIHKLLYKILYRKSDIGIRLTAAYRADDKKLLAELLEELKSIRADIETLHVMYHDLWHKMYKPFGWEQFDMKFGGLKARMDTAIIRVGRYINGEIASIPEFEAERLYFDGYPNAMIEVGSVNTFDRPALTD